MYGSLYVFAPAGRKRPCSSLVYKELKEVLTLKISSQYTKKKLRFARPHGIVGK